MSSLELRAVSSQSRRENKIPVIVAGAAGALSLLVLFLFIPYAAGYGTLPGTLYENARVLWFGSSDWIHGFAVIPLAGLLLFLKRNELHTVSIRGSWLGLPVLLASALAYWFGALADLQYVGYLSLQGFLAGLLLWFLGWNFFREIFLIWAFLTFAWPFVFLDQYLGFPLRLLMSDASAHFLNLIGIATLKDGTAILSAPNLSVGLLTGQRFSVDVADPCSGLHSLFALTMVSSFYAIIVLRRWWQVLAVTLAALPLAVLGNLCRIVMLTLGALRFGSAFAIGSLQDPSWFHEAAGALVYVAALSGVLLVAWLVKGFVRRAGTNKNDREGAGTTATECKSAAPDKPRRFAPQNSTSLWRSLVVLLITVGTGLGVSISNTSHPMGVSGIKMDLPDSVGDTLGFARSLDREHLLLPTDTEFAKKEYLSSAPTPITCEIVLTGVERSSIHRAEACLLGQGWTIVGSEEVGVALATGRIVKVKALSLSKVQDGQRLFGCFLYWFVGADRTTDDTFSRIFLTSWDRLTRGVTHRWAYVSVTGELTPNQSGSEEAKRALISRLVRFAADIIPIVQKPETIADEP